jgi:cation diffusion facilitator family transporter
MQGETPFRRVPTVAERKQERALALVITLDLLIIVPYLAIGIAVQSLAMTAEVLRGGLLLFVIGFSLRTMRRAHRGLISEYDYGIGKLERALSGTIAMLLLLAAGFIVWEAFALKTQKPSSPFLAALAMVFVTLNLGVNSVPLLPLWRSMREQPSVILLSHFRARMAKALGSLVVVTCVLIHMLSSNPLTGRIAEGIASLFVVGFMIVVAVGLLREALPDLLDRALNETMQLQITRTLATFFNEYDDLISVRTRRSGNIAHVEITLGFNADKRLGELSEVISRMQDHLQQAIPNSDILIVPRASVSKTH